MSTGTDAAQQPDSGSANESQHVAPDALFAQIPAELRHIPGITIFRDIFMRADKNDDGHISRDEFDAYFGDDALGSATLDKLFAQIDRDNSGTLEVDEIVRFFLPAYAPFSSLYETLTNLNERISEALLLTAQIYTGLDSIQRFQTRFLLKQVVFELSSLSPPVESACDALLSAALPDSAPPEAQESAVIEPRSFSTPAPSLQHAFGIGADLAAQVSRLRAFLDEMHTFMPSVARAERERHEENVRCSTGGNDCVVASNSFSVRASASAAFDAQMHVLVEAAKEAGGLFRVNVRSEDGDDDTTVVTLSHVWQSDDDLADFERSLEMADFRKAVTPMLAAPAPATQAVHVSSELFR